MSAIELILFILLVTTIVISISIFISRKPVPNIKTNDDVLEILKNGHKIRAIKAYRQLHGGSLKEAKQFLENQLKG